MVRIAVLLVLIGGILVAGPAAAQFNIFGNFGNSPPPPRPPADVPDGSLPPQPPPVQYPNNYPDQSQPPAAQYPNNYPDQSQQPAAQYPNNYPGQSQAPAAQYPNNYPAPAQSTIQSQPLAPPPGAVVATPPAVPAPTPGAAMAPPPGGPVGSYRSQPPLPAGPTQASPQQATQVPPQQASAQPDETVVVEAPTQHIDNGRAVFAGLDKITGRTIKFDAAIGETVQFGALQVTPRACYTRPPTEATNTDAFVEVDEVTLQGEIKRIFTGWMFASSPGLHAVEHPVYDVWLTDCASPEPSAVAQTAADTNAGAADVSPPAPSRSRRSLAPPAGPALQYQPR